MHIPDGYLGPATCGAFYCVMVPVWAISARSVRRTLATREAPFIALGGAFSFVMMLFNVPVPGGTTAHAVGAALAAIALGPAPAIMGVSIALAIQAVVFSDGGIISFGANCFNMAVIMPISGYAVYQALVAGRTDVTRRTIAAGIAGYLAVNLGALATAVELGLQPVIAPGYCPYGLATTVPAIMIPHLVVVGLIEAAVTAGAVRALSGLLDDIFALPSRPRRGAWIALGGLCLASPLGLLAAGSAWGEWAPEELKARLGYTPPGISQMANFWNPKLHGYSVPGLAPAAGYIISALIGVSLLLAIGLIVDHLLPRAKGVAHEDPSLVGKR